MNSKYYFYSKAYPQDAFGCTLVYSNQLDFKRWASRKGLSKKNGVDFYFDSVIPVDARNPMCQNNIPGFLADGNTTWGEALKILKTYFKVA